MRKVGILGGTFDPVHLGHIHLARELQVAKGLDQVIFCPVFLNPLKRGRTPCADPESRLEMLQRALAGKGFSIDKEDLYAKEATYTVDLLRRFHERKQGDESFYFLLGLDAVKEFASWREPEEICRLAKLLVGKRGEVSKELLALIDRYRMELVEIPIKEVSSTEVRERLARGESCEGLLPLEVIDFIREKRVYSSL